MGVKNLWHVLSSTTEKVDLREACGSVVAIDLSGWIVENAKVTPGMAKPHLRNLFFRSAALTSLGILPVFVADARKAPKIKSATLVARRGDDPSTSEKPVSLDRRRLTAFVNECKIMIQALGLPFVESPGEAEGFCVHMRLDAVVSEDSDVFCYGSDFCVWRNFSITGGRFFSVEKYDSRKIENLLGLSRDRMLMLAIMLGCDYFPTGVPGVGKESILNLFRSWDRNWNALDILDLWILSNFEVISNCSNECSPVSRCCSECCLPSGPCRCAHLKNHPEAIKIENSIKKKCQKLESDFWNSTYPQIIREFNSFSSSEESSPSFSRSPPDLCKLVSFLVTKLSWTESYSFQKTLPILSRWQISSGARDSTAVLRVIEIIKKRAVDGIPSLEVRWEFVSDKIAQCFRDEALVTVEPMELLMEFNGELVDSFMESISKKKKKPKKVIQKPTTKALKESQRQITDHFNKNPPISDKGGMDSIIDKLGDCSLNDDSAGDEDLSFIIDEILSKKPSAKKLLTSTPTLRKTACLNASRPDNNRHRGETTEKEEEPSECLSEEDSFDRMCNPSEWKK